MKKEVKDTFDILYHTIGRDMTSLMLIIRFMVLIKYAELKGSTVISMFDKMVQKHPNKVVLKSENKQWTFNQVFTSKSQFELSVKLITFPLFVGIFQNKL